MIPIIVFDLDGTLIDSALDLTAAVNRMLAGLGRPRLAPAEVLPMIGEGAARLVERALLAAGAGDADPAAALAAFLDAYALALTDHTVACPGAEAVLITLRRQGYSLALCTNKPENHSRRILDRLGLAAFFDAVVGGDSVPGCRKPDPRVLAPILAGRTGVGPGDCVVIGDSVTDVALARAAGAPVILVEGGYTPVPAARLGADKVIGTLAELPEAIAALA